MTIAYVSSAAAAANSLTLPTHQAGDFLLMFAYSASIGTPAVPSGWIIRAASAGSNGRWGTVGWKTATSNAETSGTWTNATHLACIVFRSDNYLSIGGLSSSLSASGGATLIPYAQLIQPAITRAGNGWVVGMCGTPIDGSAETAPTGMVNRVSLASNGEIAIHDTNGPVSEFSVATVATTNTTFRTFVVEVFESDIEISGGGSGGFPLSRVLN